MIFFHAQVVLVALATNPSFHNDLLSTVKSWPPMIYSALPVISAIETQLNTLSMTDALKEVSEFAYLVIDFNYLIAALLFMHPSFVLGTGRVVCI